MAGMFTAREGWAVTDVDGRIETVSSGAPLLFGVERLARGDNLLEYFPLLRKALQFDIALALGGWPAERAVIMHSAVGPVTLRYRVSRRYQELSSSAGLYWSLCTCRGDGDMGDDASPRPV